MRPPITRDAIAETERAIRPHIRRTPILTTDGADFGLDGLAIVFKLELTQRSGAFKARGAFANLLLREAPAAGVAAASGGNHGAAVAYAAKTLGHKSKIFVPETSPAAKTDRIRSYGADLEITGAYYADAVAACAAYAAETGALNAHAYDSAETILGAATLALEFEEQAPGLDAIFAPVGGGGLLAGLASWRPEGARLIAVEPEASPGFHRALAAGEPVDAPEGGLAADSLGAKRVGAINFPILKDNVAASILVSDDAIRGAQALLWDRLRIVAEPGGAAALAGLLSGAAPASGRVGVIVSGGNTGAVPAGAFNQ